MAKQEAPFVCEIRIKGQTESFANFKFQMDAICFAEWAREDCGHVVELWEEGELVLEFKKTRWSKYRLLMYFLATYIPRRSIVHSMRFHRYMARVIQFFQQ